MNGVEMLLIAVGLAMDAFAVSVGKGLTIQGQCKKACIVIGLYFGGFQSIMPLLGFLCGETVIQYIAPISRILYSVFHSIDSDRLEYAARNNKGNVHIELCIDCRKGNDPRCHSNKH